MYSFLQKKKKMQFLFKMELMPAIDIIFTNTFMPWRLISMRQMKKIGEVKHKIITITNWYKRVMFNVASTPKSTGEDICHKALIRFK